MTTSSLGATTDPQDELFAVLDADGRPTGELKARGLVHRDGDWHGALHIWVGGLCAEDGLPFVLLQRRSRTKDTFPGALDVAVGGHVRAGESLVESLREAEEEIGLEIDLAQLVRIGRRYTSALGGRDREVQEVYATRSDLPLHAYRLHEQEVDSIAFVTIAEARRVFAGESASATATELRRGSVEPVRSELTVAGFAGSGRGGYTLAALDALTRVITGGAVAQFELRD